MTKQDDARCPHCKGDGYQRTLEQSLYMLIAGSTRLDAGDVEKCRTCNGTGRAPEPAEEVEL